MPPRGKGSDQAADWHEKVMLSADRVAELADISRHRLRYWENTDLVKPTVRRELGSRTIVRLYALDAFTEVLVAAELRRVPNISLQHMRKLLDFLRSEGFDSPLRQLRFAVLGKKRLAYQRPDGSWFGDREPRQPMLLKLEPIRARAQSMFKAESRQPRSEPGRVVKRRRVLGSKPVFEGTRVPVAAVLDFLAAGRSSKEILEAYPSLTPADIAKAKLLRDVATRLREGASPDAIARWFPNLTEEEIRSAGQLPISA